MDDSGHTAPVDPRAAANDARTQAGINSRAHYMLSERYGVWQRWLGLPATAIAAVVAAFTFAQPEDALAYVIGGLATVVAALIAAQTFLNPAEASRQHQAAGIEYGAVRRKFDLLLVRREDSNFMERLTELYGELDRLAKISPTIPDSVYYRAQKELTQHAGGDRGR